MNVEHFRPNPDGPDGLPIQVQPALYKAFDKGQYGNYDLANRPTDMKINYIVIHNTETSYEEAIRLFSTPTATSANYVVRSVDGAVSEMVRPQNVAWHAGNWYINAHSIGIEHEGYAKDGRTWFTENMYQTSANLVKYLAAKYDIPLDRQHIIGHDNVPGLTPAAQKGMHWDPGTYWDWQHYFDLLGADLKQNTGDGTITALSYPSPVPTLFTYIKDLLFPPVLSRTKTFLRDKPEPLKLMTGVIRQPMANSFVSLAKRATGLKLTMAVKVPGFIILEELIQPIRKVNL